MKRHVSIKCFPNILRLHCSSTLVPTKSIYSRFLLHHCSSNPYLITSIPIRKSYLSWLIIFLLLWSFQCISISTIPFNQLLTHIKLGFSDTHLHNIHKVFLISERKEDIKHKKLRKFTLRDLTKIHFKYNPVQNHIYTINTNKCLWNKQQVEEQENTPMWNVAEGPQKLYYTSLQATLTKSVSWFTNSPTANFWTGSLCIPSQTHRSCRDFEKNPTRTCIISLIKCEHSDYHSFRDGFFLITLRHVLQFVAHASGCWNNNRHLDVNEEQTNQGWRKC